MIIMIASLKVIRITNTVIIIVVLVHTTIILSFLTSYFYFYSPRQLLNFSSSINSSAHWMVQLEHFQLISFIVC